MHPDHEGPDAYHHESSMQWRPSTLPSESNAHDGYGRRTKYLEDYQPRLAATLAGVVFAPELPQCWEYAAAVDGQRTVQGQLVRLYTNSKAEAVRTVQRLHRNLGHPSTQSLVELLESRQASEAIPNAARSYQCAACLRYKKA